MPPFGNPLSGLIPVGKKSSDTGTPYNDGGADGSTTRQNSVYAYEGYNVTPTFSVAAEHDEVVVLTAFGFPAGTTAQIEHVLGKGSGTEFIPTVIQGTPIQLSDVNTQVVIPFSGRYRVNFTGGWPVGARVMELRQQRVWVEYGADGAAVSALIADVAALEADVAAIQAEMPDDFLASAAMSGETLNLTLNNGTVIPANLSNFATDAALAAQIAAVLAAEEHAENITVAANGDVTVVDNNGAQIGSTFNTNNVTPGTYALSGTGPTAVPLVNGGVLNIDSSGLATDADVAAATAAGIASENFLLQPTISGTTITFPMQLGGSYSLPLGAVLATVDEDLVDNGDGTFTLNDPDGDSVTINTNNDVTSTVASLSALTDADRGLSLGEVLMPAGRAATITEVTQFNSNRVSATLNSDVQLRTNRAAEAGGGMVNSDGSFGNYAKFNFLGGTATMIGDSDDNGAWYVLSSALVGSALTLTPAKYPGEVRHVHLSSPTARGEITINAPSGATMHGRRRLVSGEITTHVSSSELVLRDGESVSFIASNAGNWYVQSFSEELYSGANYRENQDGTYDIWGRTTMIGAPTDVLVNYPFAIANAANTLSIQHSIASVGDAATRTVDPDLVNISVSTDFISATQFRLSRIQLDGNPVTGGMQVYWHITGAIRA